MANEIDYLPVATAVGATVDTQANFVGSTYQTVGFQAGISLPTQFNKVWRQSSMMSAALANFISSALDISVLDDGNLTNLITNLTNAISTAAKAAGNGLFVSLTDASLQTMAGPLAITSGSATYNSSSNTASGFTVENTNVAGFSQYAINSNSGTQEAVFAFGNASVTTESLAGSAFISTTNSFIIALSGVPKLAVASSGATCSLPLTVQGTFTATTKNFTIPYPENPSELLIHSSLEGPEIAVFYRGQAQLVAGTATITLPVYFEALTLMTDRTVLLTPVFTAAGQAISHLAASAVANGQFTVIATDANNPTQTFNWEVKAVRSDVPALVCVVPVPVTTTSS
jgi:hypothetical protein